MPRPSRSGAINAAMVRYARSRKALRSNVAPLVRGWASGLRDARRHVGQQSVRLGEQVPTVEPLEPAERDAEAAEHDQQDGRRPAPPRPEPPADYLLHHPHRQQRQEQAVPREQQDQQHVKPQRHRHGVHPTRERQQGRPDRAAAFTACRGLRWTNSVSR